MDNLELTLFRIPFSNASQLTRLKEICLSHGGELISGDYRNQRKILIRCQQGHNWSPDLYNILKGSWCSHPDCVSRSISKSKVGPIKDAQSSKLFALISSKGGEWVSGDYVNNRSKIEIRCDNGHIFDVPPSSLFSGTWCARCAGKYPKDEMIHLFKDIAESRNGFLLSTTYINAKSKLEFQCGKGHSPFKATADSVKNQGTWCPKCAPNGVLLDLNDLRSKLGTLAKQKDGQLITVEKTEGSDDYLATMRCSSGHEWAARAYNLSKGVWCPTCNMPGTREKICRAVFEWIFGVKFSKKRPKWLINSRDRKMELDGCNLDLGIAFEYQGEQHSKYIPFFHRDEGKFRERIEDDKRKQTLCKANGIDLIHIDIAIPLNSLQAHIIDQLLAIRPAINSSLNRTPIDLTSVKTGKDKDLFEIQSIARARGGDCISSQYISSNHHLRFRCADGHTWMAIPSSIKLGTWCNACRGKTISTALLSMLDLSDAKRIIQEKGGQFLGYETRNYKGIITIHCDKGHQWETQYGRLRKGHWCASCHKNQYGKSLKLTIGDLRKAATIKGGILLSRYYGKAGTKYLWRCGKSPDHVWTASANSVRRGSWCPGCSGQMKYLYKGDVDEFLRQEEDMWKCHQ